MLLSTKRSLLRSASTEFNPNSIPNLTWQLDPTQKTYSDVNNGRTTPVSADGATVGTWGSIIGATDGYAANGVARRPLLKLAYKAGRTMILFDDTDDTLNGFNAMASLARPYTLVWIEAPTSIVAASTKRLWQSTAVNVECSLTRQDGITVFLGGVASSFLIGDTNPHLCVLRCDNSGNTVRIDGVDRTTDGTQTADFSATMVMGRNGFAAESANCAVGDALAYGRYLSLSETQQLETWLKTRWSIP